MIPIATVPAHPPFSWLALLSMLVVVGVSLLMYVMLVRRWTSRRQWVSLSQWARESGYRLRPVRRDALPGPLLELVTSDAQVRYHLCDPRTTLVQFQTDPIAPGTHTSAGGAAAAPRWSVLIRHRPAPGPPAALRPGAQALSLIDLLPLSKYPAMTLGDRFVVYGTDPRTARALAESRAVALLPPDVALILLEHHLVLDFSSRPFDPIEFGRMIALADQLAQVSLSAAPSRHR